MMTSNSTGQAIKSGISGTSSTQNAKLNIKRNLAMRGNLNQDIDDDTQAN